MQEKMLTVPEVARVLSVSRGTVFALIRKGDLESTLVGERGRRIRPDVLERYVARQSRRRRHGRQLPEAEPAPGAGPVDG